MPRAVATGVGDHGGRRMTATAMVSSVWIFDILLALR